MWLGIVYLLEQPASIQVAGMTPFPTKGWVGRTGRALGGITTGGAEPAQPLLAALLKEHQTTGEHRKENGCNKTTTPRHELSVEKLSQSQWGDLEIQIVVRL